MNASWPSTIRTGVSTGLAKLSRRSVSAVGARSSAAVGGLDSDFSSASNNWSVVQR